MVRFMIAFTILAFTVTGCRQGAPDGSKQLQLLKIWLEEESASGGNINEQSFASQELSKEDAMEAAGLIHDHFNQKLKAEYF
jgi:hypothetical protein